MLSCQREYINLQTCDKNCIFSSVFVFPASLELLAVCLPHSPPSSPAVFSLKLLSAGPPATWARWSGSASSLCPPPMDQCSLNVTDCKAPRGNVNSNCQDIFSHSHCEQVNRWTRIFADQYPLGLAAARNHLKGCLSAFINGSKWIKGRLRLLLSSLLLGDGLFLCLVSSITIVFWHILMRCQNIFSRVCAACWSIFSH